MNRTQAGPPDSPVPSYVFGVFRLEPDGRLFRGNTTVPLASLELKALRALLAHAGKIVSPAQMRQALGGATCAAADTLSDCIASLRARLEPGAGIETVYKRGYRLVAAVRPRDAAPKRELPRLAILPFSTELGVPEYLGPALAEEVGDLLSRGCAGVAALVAQGSVVTLARRGLSPQQVGSMLNADLVLTGTVRALASHYRLEATMMAAGDGSQLWIEDMLVERKRIGNFGRELADRVAYRLQEDGLSISAEVMPAEPADDPARHEAWEIYRQAHHEWQSFERHRMQDALRRLTRAIELDPSLTPARIDLANLCVTQCSYGFMSPTSAAGIVKKAAEFGSERALASEEILPALGWVQFHVDRDLAGALRAFSESAHLAYDPWVTRIRTMFALSRHRMDEAVELLREAMRLDPWSPWIHGCLGWAFHLADQADESVSQIEETLERFPDYGTGSVYGAIILAHNGMAKRAVELTESLAQRSPHSDVATAVHAYALACEGREAEARVHLERLRWLGQERYVLPSFTAAAYLALGEESAALEHLRLAEQARCPWFFQMLADPRLKPLHRHAEFKAMLRIPPEMEAAAACEAESG